MSSPCRFGHGVRRLAPSLASSKPEVASRRLYLTRDFAQAFFHAIFTRPSRLRRERLQRAELFTPARRTDHVRNLRHPVVSLGKVGERVSGPGNNGGDD